MGDQIETLYQYQTEASEMPPIKNEMPSWEEWNNLTDDQRRYSKFKILHDLYFKIDCQHIACENRLPLCEKRMEKLEKQKWMNRLTSVFFGILAGICTVLGIKFDLPNL